MNCDECGKEMRCGFGVGERPFSKYHCADCVVRLMDNAQCKWALGKIATYLEEPLLYKGRSYKIMATQLQDQIYKAKTLARLVLESK